MFKPTIKRKLEKSKYFYKRLIFPRLKPERKMLMKHAYLVSTCKKNQNNLEYQKLFNNIFKILNYYPASLKKSFNACYYF